MNLEKAKTYIENNRVAQDERPAFHLTAPVGWINDPNGFSIFQNHYHMFYQYHPYSDQWGPMHWGHAISDDLMTWKELPVALAPDQEYDSFGCFSGTALETKEGHVLFYTGVKQDGDDVYQNQCVAIGDGTHYQKVEANPVLCGSDLPHGYSQADFRDPKLLYQDGHYQALIAGKNDKDQPAIILCASPDLRNWHYVRDIAYDINSNLGKVWECPDLFSLDGSDILMLSIQDMSQGPEFHNGNIAAYMIGHYDETFHSDGLFSLDDGLDFYAPETIETKDHRRIMIGWLQNWDSFPKPANQKWANMMSIPRELHVVDGHLTQQPVKELNAYHGDYRVYEHYSLLGTTTLPGVSGRYLDMRVTLHNAADLEIQFAKDDTHHISLAYRNQMLVLDRAYSGMVRDSLAHREVRVKYPQKELQLRIILDRNSLEVFVNRGEQVLSMTFYTPLEAEGISFTSTMQADLSVEKYTLKKSASD